MGKQYTDYNGEDGEFYDRRLKKKQLRRNHRRKDREVLRDIEKGQYDVEDIDELLQEEEEY